VSDHPSEAAHREMDAADQALDQRLRWATREVQASFDYQPITGQLDATRRRLRRRARIRAGATAVAMAAILAVAVVSGLRIRANQHHPATNPSNTTPPVATSTSPEAAPGDLQIKAHKWTRKGNARYQIWLELSTNDRHKVTFDLIQAQNNQFAVTSTCTRAPTAHCVITVTYLGSGSPPSTWVTVDSNAGGGPIDIPGP